MTRKLWMGALGAGALLAGLVALAEGVSTSDPLYYAGVLEESGAPVDGTRDIQVRLWSSATDTNAAAQKCATTPVSKTQVSSGHFRMVLDASCVAAIHQNPDLWVEITVEGQTLPRSKLGAVPFAVEADHAKSASSATGALATQLDQLARPVAHYGGKSFSIGGNYCGATAARTGDLGGFAGAKTLCETACGSPSAHMCLTDELVRQIAMGWSSPTTGWAGGIGEEYDCGYWTCSSSSSCGAYSTQGEVLTPGGFNKGLCGETRPVLCCD